jgi:choice-of-anchor C domain-containing protein
LRTISLWCVVVTMLATAGASANLITNGSFETGVNPGSFTTLYAPNSNSIAGWTVTQGSIDYIGSYWKASDGARSIDLAGNGMGAIADPFYTDLSLSYLLEFDLAGNPDGGLKVKTVDVSVAKVGSTAPPTVYEFTFDTTGKTKTNMGWTTQSLLFNGFGANTQIMFASGMGSSPYGPALDNVRVTANGPAVNPVVPEPMSIFLGIMGLGSIAGFRKLRMS